MAAAHHKIDNIVAIVDRNGFSATGAMKEGSTLTPCRINGRLSVGT